MSISKPDVSYSHGAWVQYSYEANKFPDEVAIMYETCNADSNSMYLFAEWHINMINDRNRCIIKMRLIYP